MPIFKNKQKKQVVELIDRETGREIEIEAKPYLLILSNLDGDDDFVANEGKWIKIEGRTSVIGYLCSDFYNINPLESYILTGKIPLGSEVSVYSFLRFCIEYNKGDVGLTIEDMDNHIHSTINRDINLNAVYAREINKGIK